MYSVWLQCKLDIRNKNVLIVYYILPLIFFLIMGSVFTTIDPNAKSRIIQSMSIVAISMAAYLGTPVPIVEIFSSDIKKTYKVGNVPLWVILITSFLSALVHILIVSAIIFIISPIIFKADIPNNILMYFLFLILVISVSSIIGILIGLISKSNTVMTMFSQLIFLPSMILSGTMFPREMLPTVIGRVSNILPATHGMNILTSLGDVNIKLISPLFLIGIVSLGILVLVYRKIQID
ncbi:ABC transporter permease [Clostridium sp. UBA1652]|uniref:ABC transporter permease n=1 Tax=Clostridium sp. UBA1652 TaxID=1946348 RepID=UPI00257BC37D|nr:ABC transporter permease [Clostridium sp. UBA1652]